MERYDYTDRDSAADQVLAEVEELSNKERLALREAMEQIKKESETEAVSRHREFFDNAIFPVLKEFAEQTSSILDVERDKREIIQATLRNPCGLSIMENCHGIYMALLMAVQVIIDVEEADPVLVLTYDCQKFIS